MNILPGSEKWTLAQADEMTYWESSFKNFPKDFKEVQQAARAYAVKKMNETMSKHRNPPKPLELLGKYCLEAGSGPFPFLMAWPMVKYRVAIDPLFNFYKQWTGIEPGVDFNGVKIVESKIEDFRFWRQRKFDHIICSNILDHVDDPKDAFDNMVRHLDPNGVLWLDVFIKSFQDRDAHPHTFPTAEVFVNWFNMNWDKDMDLEYVIVYKINKVKSRLFTKVRFKCPTDKLTP
jgi:SAM-dependent methyltransferase